MGLLYFSMSDDIPLTEEQYMNAHAEDQIRSDIEIGLFGEVIRRDDVEKVFDFRAGHKNRQNQVKDNIEDTRLFIQIYVMPSRNSERKFIYRVSGPVEIERIEITDEVVDADDISEDAHRFSKFAIDNKRVDFEESFEVVKASNDEHGKWGLLADRTINELKSKTF